MNHVIILAAGQSQRIKSRKDKLLLPINGKPLVYYSIMAFNDHPEIDTITVVANKSNKTQIQKLIKQYRFSKVNKIVLGGLQRQGSVEKGFKALTAEPDDVVLVHNGANPLPSHEEISEVIVQTQETGACIVGHFVTSTIKEVDDQHIIKTHNRKKLFAAETPQAAAFKIMQRALENAQDATDEAMMFEAINQPVAYVQAHEDNTKITTQADYARLRTVLGDLPDKFRIGIGQDSHMFEEKKKGLTLAGLKFKDELKLKANSDGDVILHAIFNALSQAIGDKSIGAYADAECKKGVKDSKKYLTPLLKKIKKKGFALNSLGVMIEAAKPKIDPLVPEMKKSLAAILDLKPNRIGITATTGEQCTAFGEGLGIQCLTIASLTTFSNKSTK